ncbi:hypothetical protein VEV11M_43900 (plasmid) [Escherichia coli]|nr:hypothetical protein VEV11M_43900 [Escherichia coli]
MNHSDRRTEAVERLRAFRLEAVDNDNLINGPFGAGMTLAKRLRIGVLNR